MEKDSGTYTCVVKNRYGEVKQFQKFVVKGNIKIFILIRIILSGDSLVKDTYFI